MSSGVQNIRLRHPETKPATPKPPRHTGILQDQLRRAQRRPWSPGFSLAVRILLLVRVAGAMYSNIDDCDEVFNFWEPLHFLDRGYGFQTWEVSPEFSIRSWSYILLHIPPARIASFFLGVEKRPAFFAVRIFLAFVSALAEAKFYRTVATKINERVGRYLFFMLLFSTGMWNASTAFLPSSFAMYMIMIAFSYALDQPSYRNPHRTLMATLSFAAGAIIGWPFALALAVPFVVEELFVFGADRVPSEVYQSWLLKRWKRLIAAGLTASLIFVPVIVIDSLAYGKLTVVPWNIVRYNIFGGAERGPELYGTSPWNFYFLNLILNFNVLVPFSLLALPALLVTYVVDRKRLGLVRPGANESSPFTILAIRLVPFYLWLGILSWQPHKEERFMFPAYPLLCFNAAVTLYLMRGWQEALFIKLTSSPYRASQSMLFARFTLAVVVATSILSVSRIMALWHYYHAPMTVLFALETEELPRLLNSTGLLPVYPPKTPVEDIPRIDLTPIGHFNLTLCVGKEWHRFAGSYLVPQGVGIDFVKSDFNGLLPGHFKDIPRRDAVPSWWPRPGTSYVPQDQNDLNKEEASHYVPIETCDYLMDLDFPLHPVTSPLEPRYAVDDKTWERIYCRPFIDVRHSRLLTRAFWAPGEAWQSRNEFGDYCLLKNKRLVGKKESDVAQLVSQGSLSL
ncbi:Alpha-1,2-mannosyltransferase ALG9 [Hypsizygus marmoreus]|uniref:Mannosyltransferase n=1 Tax=Hypsizygus marmoreus TaxID=39966 RepID=A0A369KA70_HYPMA|nr:Alpha-1,2-mannosyltransferase ALG9 [Hypsizygus marmoreus]